MIPQADRCPQCGIALTGDAPAGLCPKCRLNEGLESTAVFSGEGERSDDVKLLGPSDSFGGYKIGKLLGKGGMGAVYEAEHTSTGRHVALKVVGHRFQSPQHRHRFLREGRLAASINHPNCVYIYGTEEVDGTPVISMELARGGTLQEWVKRDGPLAIGKAVDVILDVIAGLEAAQAKGILHRDIKPSNCFVNLDGTVKVGDFGLSISTAPRPTTNLTESGLFLGTPTFSSPEQLRGDELDVRSDIYSVGVTLYYLLTGQTPFHAKQMVQLLATVLERPAPSPRCERSEIPPGLAKVVMRCLAKQSTDRFKSYDELREALRPYSTEAPTPATLGFRVLATCIDVTVVIALTAVVPSLWSTDFGSWNEEVQAIWSRGPQGKTNLMLMSLIGMLLELVYFAVLEGIWGASAGKWLCGLRVAGPRREVAGVCRALLRATILSTSGWLPHWLLYAIDPAAGIAASTGDDWKSFTVFAMSCACQLSLFCTGRRRNGYAGLHELISGTRVVRTRSRQQRPKLSPTDESLPEMRGARQMGPYQVLGVLEAETTHEVLLAYDTRLLRKVWVRKSTQAAPSISPSLREVARIGRLHWLNGGDDDGCPWDAYEAPLGKPLLELIGERQPWEAVRFWLLDLATELGASLEDGSFPSVLELDRVWISADGRAKLLDFPAPGLNAEKRNLSAFPPTVRDAATVGIFLKRVAIAALEGDVLPPDDAQARNISAALPLPARALLSNLGLRADAEVPTSQLAALTRQPATVPPGRQLGAFATCWLPVLMAMAVVMPSSFAQRRFLATHPEVGDLAGLLNLYQSLEEPGTSPDGARIAKERNAIEIYVANHFRATIGDNELWSDPLISEIIDVDAQKLLKGFAAAQRAPSPQELAEAEALLGSIVMYVPDSSLPAIFHGLAEGTIFFLIAFVALPSLVSALLFRNTLVLRTFEMAVVTKSGAPASRLRLVWRNALLWLFVLVILGLMVLVVERKGLRGTTAYLVLVMIGWKMVTAERGPHDRVAGTRLVPR